MDQGRTSGELRRALGRSFGAFAGVAWMSALVNVLTLTGSFFMLEVYDRVIPSRSIPTLVGLCILALALFVAQGVLEALRGRVLSRVGAALDADLCGRVLGLSLQAPLRGASPEVAGQPLRDLDQIRAFLAGSGPAALFDLPWLPAYVALCFLFHPLIGVAAIAGVVLLASLTLATDLASRAPVRAASLHAARRQALSETARRNAESVAAMGLQDRMCRRWEAVNNDYVAAQQRSADVTGGLGAVSKTARMVLQSGVLALGAWLVINNQASGGIIIAASILVARALAPVELAIANWRGFVAARQSWRRLSETLARLPVQSAPLVLPAPRTALSVEGVNVVPPGTGRAAVFDASFQLAAGQALGVIGPSASGKSSLARALVRVWAPVRGRVRLDGAALDQWSAEDLGRHVGYLPQEAELFAGTVAENIGRFDPQATSEAVVAAGRAAGTHELILRLPHGYDTPLGEAGAGLSAGQRQRIGLARALYGEPFLVVLDEPNANLDAEGEHALTQAILGVRTRGGICVVIAHRPSALAAVDHVLMMADGRVQAFGPKDEVFKRVLRPAAVAEAPSSGAASEHTASPGLPRAKPLNEMMERRA
ncbi:type I secretion system permease/ATPase [Methylobacterium sp. WL103]|uniref:type I secretion system permease/ATPase n=1 Tax=Methylobacterium sp. WL103 TaxID=2603891 RepID=UPI0011CB7426|nr:type I secretion system permease/ATPase [Methylobacterium sp. WL103]TXN07015.1 type I secretion system permease/ATPase [Methylobacterium sp. WL103]